MSKPIIDKAEVSVDFPDKYYHGFFGHTSRYGVKVDADGIHISLDREGEEQRHVAFHLHHYLFAGILEDVADGLQATDELSAMQRELIGEAAKKLLDVLETPAD